MKCLPVLFITMLFLVSCAQEIIAPQVIVFTGDSRFANEKQSFRTAYNMNADAETGDLFQNHFAKNSRTIINYAGPGYRPSNVVAQISTILAQNPQKIFIQVGSADILNPGPNTMPGPGWHTILQSFGGIKVFVTEPIHFRDTAAYATWNSSLLIQQAYNDSLRRLVAKYRDAVWIDMNDKFCYANGFMKPEYSHTDGIHNSYSGYLLMMHVLSKYVAQ